MKLFDKSKYDQIAEPLSRVDINHLFARSVVERKVNGSVYVDNLKKPGTFYIIHPYGMSLLFGETENIDFNSNLIDYALNTFKTRDKYEWLQAFPDEWNTKISALFGDYLIKSEENSGTDSQSKIEVHTRVNFKFNREKYLDFKIRNVCKNYKIVRTDREIYKNMQGSVIPRCFWKDAEQFYKYGIGFSLLFENQAASTAYSAFIHDNQLELGIETQEKYRGRGFALHACSTLIDYCLAHDYEPVWSCRLENAGSYKLAQKLGFEPTLYIPFYRLRVCVLS